MAALSTLPLFTDPTLKAYWALDNTLNATAGGVGFNLTGTNSPTFVSGEYAQGLSFGSANTNKNAYTTGPDGIDGGAISLVGWFKNLTENTVDGTAYTLIAHMPNGGGTSHVNEYIAYKFTGGVQVIQFVRDKIGVSTDFTNYTQTLGTSIFHHLAFTYDGTNYRGYLDGFKVVGPTAASGNGNTNGNGGTMIGANITSGAVGVNFASSVADDCAIFNRALSDLEVLQLATNNSGAFLLGLL